MGLAARCPTSRSNRARVLGALAISLAGPIALPPGRARADPPRPDPEALARSLDVWTQVEGRLQLQDPSDRPSCAQQLAALGDAGTPASFRFHLDHDIPGLAAGTHPWTAARAACAAITRAARLDDFVRWADRARSAPRGGAGDDVLDRCRLAYQAALGAGIAPSERVEGPFDATIQQIHRTWCAGAATEDPGASPYRRLLRNDKLRVWLKDTTSIRLPGVRTVTARALAVARVWFEEGTPQKVCTNGLPIHTLYRYQFDAEHKLVRDSVRDYCGHPPGSAWR